MADSSTLVDRVKIFVESSGTGPFQLGNAVPAFRGSEALTDGLTYSYAVESGSDYEVGQGVYVLAVDQLLRAPTLSSAGGAPVAFPANVTINFTALAADLTAGLAGTGTVTSIQGSGGTTGMTLTGGPITGAGTLTLGGVLGVGNGGTAGSTATEARAGIGLGNVNNTSDANKPISIATQAALDIRTRVITAAMAGIPDDGDPDADVTAELVALAALAAGNDLEIQLGPRVYRTDGTTIEFETSVTGSGLGAGDTLIQSTAAGVAGPVVKLIGAATLSNLRIDGNVSADPSPWNAGNYDSFTGSEGLIVDADDCVVRNVAISNVLRAAFKVELPRKRILFENCRSDRSRGNFGDGFIAMGAEQIRYLNCLANDFTRIGFVSDSYGASPGTYSKSISYENCRATDGHDASINFGGLEYNAGFWSEKSGQVYRKNCVADSCGDRGFTDASGEDVDGSGMAQFVSENCLTVGTTDLGHVAYGLDGIPINSTLINCRAVVQGLSAFSFTGGLSGDIVSLTDCSSSLSGDLLNRSSVKASPGTTVIERFTETWETTNNTYRDAADNYYGSLSHFADTIGKVVVRDWRTYDNGGSVIPSVFKFLPATASTLNLHVERCYLRGVYINHQLFTAEDVTWDRFGSVESPAGLTIVRGGVIFETSTPFSSPIYNAAEGFVFEGVRFDFSSSAGEMHFNNIDSVDPYSKLVFRGCAFIKNFETGNRAIKLTMLGGASGTIAGTTNANNISATDAVVTNTGGATTNPVFFIDSNTDAAGKLGGNGKKSSTITNMVQSGKLEASASFTAWGS